MTVMIAQDLKLLVDFLQARRSGDSGLLKKIDWPSAGGWTLIAPDAERLQMGGTVEQRLQKSMRGEEIVSLDAVRTSPHPRTHPQTLRIRDDWINGESGR